MSGDKTQEGKSHFGGLWTIVFVAVTAVVGGALALAEEPFSASVIKDLEDPAEPAVEIPVVAEPVEVPISAADIMGSGKETVFAGNIKNLFQDGMIEPPSTNMVSTLREAVDAVIQLAGKSWVQVSTNDLEILAAPYKGLGDGKSTMEWRQVLRYLLNPHGLNFAEDGTMVLIGKSDEVEVKRKIVAQERLTNNWTPISFTANVDEGGTPLRTALLAIAQNAGIYINLDYMDPKDLGITPKTVGPELTAEDVAAGQEGAAPVSQVKRTTFSTPSNQTVEWRIVLREVLNPAAYDFIEVDGVVRVATFTKIQAWETEKNNAKPMEARVVRVFHASPAGIAERIVGMKVLRHPNASISVTQTTADKASSFSGGQAGIAMASGTQIGASSIGSGSAFGNLARPRTPPAVLIYDIAENIDSIVQKIRLLDIREKQVLIEALILDLNNDFSKEIGMNWSGFENIALGSLEWNSTKNYTKNRNSLNSHDWNRTDTGTALTDSADSLSRGTDTASSSSRSYSEDNTRSVNDTFTDIGENLTTAARNSATAFTGMLGPLDFSAVLKLIQQNVDNRVLSSPVLVIGDHSEAVIQVGTAEPIPITRVSYIGENSQNVETETEWQILMTGVMLWVSPEVTESGAAVRLSVHPQITNPDGFVEAPDGTRYPNVVTRELDTRVTVPSGNTLMLGGLIRTVEGETIDKVPFLGDIPLLGRLFRNRRTTKTQRNLVILIRPTILDDEDPDSGFEDPAMKIIDPMMATSGRNLVTPAKDDKMEKREASILKKLGVKDDAETASPDETSVMEPADAEKTDPDVTPVVEEKSAP